MNALSARDTRRAVVDTAYRLFKRHGFHATGIDRVVAEAGIAKMTLYRHFPSKDALMLAVLDDRARRFQAVLDRIDAGNAAPDAKLDGLFDWYVAWFAREDFHGCLFQHALAEFSDPSHPVFQAAAAQKLALLIQVATIAAPDGAGEQAIARAKRAAAVILAAVRAGA